MLSLVTKSGGRYARRRNPTAVDALVSLARFSRLHVTKMGWGGGAEDDDEEDEEEAHDELTTPQIRQVIDFVAAATEDKELESRVLAELTETSTKARMAVDMCQACGK